MASDKDKKSSKIDRRFGLAFDRGDILPHFYEGHRQRALGGLFFALKKIKAGNKENMIFFKKKISLSSGTKCKSSSHCVCGKVEKIVT